jgi:hypothetical protein
MEEEKTTITLEEDQAALVIGPSGSPELYMPKLDEEENVPPHVIYFVELMILTTNDQEFVDEIMEKAYKRMDELADENETDI